MKDKNTRIIMFIIIAASLILGGFGAVYGVPLLSNIISTWGNAEILALITIIGGLSPLIVPIIKYHKKEKFLFQIDIQILYLSDNVVSFSASIENVGDERIKPKISILYIDQGIPTENGSDVQIGTKKEKGAIFYDFPFIHEHREGKHINGRPVCILTERCCVDKKFDYPVESIEERFKTSTLYRTSIKLEHLSDKSLMYIKKKEKFSEDIVLQFKQKGVYRVSLIVTTEKNCECATKQFYIKESLSDIESNRK